MHSVDEAVAAVVAHAGRQATARVPLEWALGAVLAEDVVSDIDSPPFAKALMDGFAVRSDDLMSGIATLRCGGEIAAGDMNMRTLPAGETLRIMTGAPMPTGADAVVMIENSQLLDDNSVRLIDETFRPSQHVMDRGREIAVGDVALQSGTLLGPIELGVLATVGKTTPLVFSRPTIGILSTGDELVLPMEMPTGGQIRNSNSQLLAGLARRSDADPRDFGIARDNEASLVSRIEEGLACDVLVLSGGVSAGKFDLVPRVLAKLGVQQVFHKVQFKPGKPLWFGKHAKGIVFGLPGNPVSTLACFSLFVRTALNVRRGLADPLPRHFPATLAESMEYPTDRLTYHPAQVDWSKLERPVSAAAWFGSADLKALTAANCFVVLPAGLQRLAKGSAVQVLPF